MKPLSLALLAAVASAATVSVASVDAQITAGPVLEKRYKEVVVNKDYKHLQLLKKHGTTSAAPLKAWVRTIYETKVEIVTPTVVAGVTFSAQPPATTDGLEPWVSLNNDGSPKTIRPKMKNGVIKNKSPDYSTWFQTATTVRYTKEELKAHNMADDEVFEHEQLIPEDLTYHALNPILRCTPDFYKHKGMAKDVSPEPFCFPRDNSVLYFGRTYFVTWYHRFFDDNVRNVKLHLSFVKELARQKGLKRGLPEPEVAEEKRAAEMEKGGEMGLDKRSVVIEKGGSMGKVSFFTSDWLPKDAGMLALDIDEEWFDDADFSRKVLISLQPDSVDDADFAHMDNYVVVEVARRAKVSKGHQEDITAQEERQRMKALYGDNYEIEEGLDYEKYVIIMTMPTCVLLAAVGMYFFVRYNARGHDLTFLKKVKFAKRKRTRLPRRNDSQYTELPQWEGPKAD